jgi:hypothetical protein
MDACFFSFLLSPNGMLSIKTNRVNIIFVQMLTYLAPIEKIHYYL